MTKTTLEIREEARAEALKTKLEASGIQLPGGYRWKVVCNLPDNGTQIFVIDENDFECGTVNIERGEQLEIYTCTPRTTKMSGYDPLPEPLGWELEQRLLEAGFLAGLTKVWHQFSSIHETTFLRQGNAHFPGLKLVGIEDNRAVMVIPGSKHDRRKDMVPEWDGTPESLEPSKVEITEAELELEAYAKELTNREWPVLRELHKRMSVERQAQRGKGRKLKAGELIYIHQLNPLDIQEFREALGPKIRDFTLAFGKVHSSRIPRIADKQEQALRKEIGFYEFEMWDQRNMTQRWGQWMFGAGALKVASISSVTFSRELSLDYVDVKVLKKLWDQGHN